MWVVRYTKTTPSNQSPHFGYRSFDDRVKLLKFLKNGSGANKVVFTYDEKEEGFMKEEAYGSGF